ncbi:PLA2G4B isoform 4, partial [Pongo abelii]
SLDYNLHGAFQLLEALRQAVQRRRQRRPH